MATKVDPPSISAGLDASLEKIKKRIQKALDAATKTLADDILREGRSDISSAGNFGTRWTQGFTAETNADGDFVRVVTFRQAVPYWRVFQYGAIIHGRPLLWIPINDGDPRARDFPGRLFRVNRKSGGVPLLMSADDKQVKYTGHESVRIPKKFHLVEIINAQAKTFGALYRYELSKG